MPVNKAEREYRKVGFVQRKTPLSLPEGGVWFLKGRDQKRRLFSPKDLILPPPVRLKLRLYS